MKPVATMSISTTLVGLTILASTAPAAADFSGNLNYDSPSKRDVHVGLGIDVPLVSRRSWKRDAVAYQPEDLSFTHGVASGDPWPESVLLWTRIAPSKESDASNVTVEGTAPMYNHDTQTYIDASANPVCVDWAVYEDADGESTGDSVSSGKAYTTSDIDFTVKVEACGLKPFTSYRYQFAVCDSDKKSIIGRTKTAPAAEAEVEQVKLAVFSCSNYRKSR